jgi:hypothetical protein
MLKDRFDNFGSYFQLFLVLTLGSTIIGPDAESVLNSLIDVGESTNVFDGIKGVALCDVFEKSGCELHFNVLVVSDAMASMGCDEVCRSYTSSLLKYFLRLS